MPKLTSCLGTVAIALAGFAVPLLTAGPATAIDANSACQAQPCGDLTGHQGDQCRFTKPSLTSLPDWATPFFVPPVSSGAVRGTMTLLDAGHGNQAMGNCYFGNGASTGTCTLWTGMGTLKGIQAALNMTADQAGSYVWDGTFNRMAN